MPISDRLLTELRASFHFDIVESCDRYVPYSPLQQAPILVCWCLRCRMAWPNLVKQFVIRARKPRPRSGADHHRLVSAFAPVYNVGENIQVSIPPSVMPLKAAKIREEWAHVVSGSSPRRGGTHRGVLRLDADVADRGTPPDWYRSGHFGCDGGNERRSSVRHDTKGCVIKLTSMRQYDDCTPHEVVEGRDQQRTAGVADDQCVCVTVPADPPSDTSPRHKDVIVLLVAVACAVFGAKLLTISALGSPMPLVDQWDGEAAGLYSPYLKGTLSFTDLLAAHNEHRILIFRLLALLHLELAGEWNTRLEMILGAIVHTAAITWLVALLMPFLAPQRRMLLACFVVILFALPLGYENTLWGFQGQLYFSLLYGIAALVAFAPARAFSVRWFCGLAAAVLGYFSFATGVAIILAAGAVAGLQLATNARRRCRREFAGVIVMASIALAMILWVASSARPTSTPWTFTLGLLLIGGRVIVALIPVVWFCHRTMSVRAAVSDRVWVAVGICGWITIQFVLLAYGRGTAIVVRYMDIVLLLYPVALVAVCAYSNRARVGQFSRYARPGAMTWLFAVASAFGVLGCVFVFGAIDWSQSACRQAVNVQAYLSTRNVDYLKPTGRQGRTVDLAYPNPQRLAVILSDPNVRAVLPPELRPADADNAGAWNRMLLKGSLASVTATAVRLTLSVGPALVGLGVGLLFAARAGRSISSVRRMSLWHRRSGVSQTPGAGTARLIAVASESQKSKRHGRLQNV